jgi:hypothetical protein
MSVCLQVIPAADRDDCTARGDMARAESATLQLETGVAPVLVCWTVPIGRDTEAE